MGLFGGRSDILYAWHGSFMLIVVVVSVVCYTTRSLTVCSHVSTSLPRRHNHSR